MDFSAAVAPDYRGANLAGVVPGLMAPPGARPGWLPEEAAQAEQVVLFVVDGMGWLQLRDRLERAPNLAAMTGGAVTSVAPSTTACALTSLVVGAAPVEHGIVGYRLAVEGPTGAEVMNVLKWRTGSGDARPFVDPGLFQVRDPFGGSPVPVVSKVEFAGTAFTEAHQRGARQIGWHAASGLAVEVDRLVAGGEPMVYAYYDGVDRVAHVYGLGAHYDAELTALDRMVGDVLDRVPPSVAVVVTADHGQVEVGPNLLVPDPALLEMVALQSGEARFRWLHARDRSPAGVAALAAAAAELYGASAWAVTLEQLDELGWLGGPVPAPFRDRLGDVALIPFAPVGFLEHAEAGDARLVCRHGALSPEEMLVPLVAARGRLGG